MTAEIKEEGGIMMLGQKVKMRRKAKGMTQNELAELIDISQSHLTQIETLKRVPSESLEDKLLGFIGEFDEEKYLKKKSYDLGYAHGYKQALKKMKSIINGEIYEGDEDENS